MRIQRTNSGPEHSREKRVCRYRNAITTAVAVGLASYAGATFGADGGTNLETATLLKLMSVEDLMNVSVTSVSKKSEKLGGTPAAIAVISQDDIRLSGVTTIPGALRMAPGVQVSRVDSHQWAVGVRGFNDTFAQKLLVLMDGRSIYTPLFSGVHWQAQDAILDDLDRIEVIRGPGASVWGANAVNGVISIVSKPAKETQGLLLSGGGGSSQLGLASARYGGELGENTHYRVYGKYSVWDDFPMVGGGRNNDAWWRAQSGFRLDHEPSDANLFTVQGDFYSLSSDTTVPQVQPVPPVNSSLVSTWDQQGANFLARWTHTVSENSDFSIQAYHDYTDLDTELLDQRLNTFDLDARHRFALGSRQEVVWGGGYRLNSSRVGGSSLVSFSRRNRNDQLANAFLQDELTIVPEHLRLTLGSKVEHNDYTGVEVEPSARISWTPHERHTVWAAVSRAVRTPSQIEADSRINLSALPPNPLNPLPSVIAIVGNEEFDSEKLIAYELGYRFQPQEKLSLDLAGFVNSYDELRGTTERLDFSTASVGYVGVLSDFANNVEGTTYGGELAVTWQVANWWRLYGSYSLAESDLKAPPNLLTGEPTEPPVSNPRHQVSLRSSMAFGRDVDFDMWWRWVDEIPNSGIVVPGVAQPSQSIPSYATLDVRLAWRPGKNLEFSVVGQNLLESSHREFNPTFVSTTYAEVPRSVFGKLTWRF